MGSLDAYNYEKANMLARGLDVEANKARILLSGDGFSNGSDDVVDFKGRRGIGIAEVPQIVDVVSRGFLGYEALIRFQGGHGVGKLSEYRGIPILNEFAKRLNNWVEPVIPKVDVRICNESGKVANDYCPSYRIENFIVGEEPTEVCTIHKKPEEPSKPVLKPCSYYFKRWNFKKWWRCIRGVNR
jgi:hypothetical protein